MLSELAVYRYPELFFIVSILSLKLCLFCALAATFPAPTDLGIDVVSRHKAVLQWKNPMVATEQDRLAPNHLVGRVYGMIIVALKLY